MPKLAPDATDAEFDAWMEALPPCPGIGFADDDIENDVAAALADLESGRCVPHEIVSKWFQTWGTPDQRGFWEWYAAQDG